MHTSDVKFRSTHIRGKGRGKHMGFPTINLTIPPDFTLADGIYAAWVTIGEKRYKGALHYGPIPTFEEHQKSLEVFLLDAREALPSHIEEHITVVTVKRLRDVLKFDSTDALTRQISEDVAAIHTILG